MPTNKQSGPALKPLCLRRACQSNWSTCTSLSDMVSESRAEFSLLCMTNPLNMAFLACRATYYEEQEGHTGFFLRTLVFPGCAMRFHVSCSLNSLKRGLYRGLL